MKHKCLITIILLGISCSGCRQTSIKVDEAEGDAQRLYTSSLAIINEYSALLTSAIDSTEAKEIFKTFNNKLDSLNFTVAPNTDMKLREGENDTLYTQILAIRKLYEGKLKDFGKLDTEFGVDIKDSIAGE